ncbi:MAG: RibD family protein, partial [Myxococcota bacterium]
AHWYLVPWIGLSERARGNVPPEVQRLMSTYGVYPLLPLLARALGRAVTVSHFAQSLDGRIATHTGDSRWIGDRSNRVHAHRMRALCDVILIGAETARRDRPQLNVRHVSGRDPVRMVLGDAELQVEFQHMRAASNAPILHAIAHAPSLHTPQAELLQLPSDGQRIAPQTLLHSLFERGLYTVYIEGGQHTTSGFLTDGVLDLVQVHTSPLILGGGPTGFALAHGGAATVAQGYGFDAHRFEAAGSGMLFVGWRSAQDPPQTTHKLNTPEHKEGP